MSLDELEKKWLNNDLSESEKAMFNQLDDADLNHMIVEHAKHFKASNFVEIESFEAFKNKYYRRQSSTIKFSYFIKIAAVLIIGLGLYFLIFNDKLTHVKTLASEKQTIELSDYTIVTLNSETEIEYNKKNWKENRTLKLKGEAYFEVAKGEIFDVVTKQGVISVIGTQFNVKDRTNYFEVKCFEGIVKVSLDTITRFLKAGDTFRFLNGKFIESKTKVSIPEWTENMSVFEAVTIKEVFSELERQYNVKINYKIDSNRLFTGGFVHDNLNSALIAITQPMNLTFEVNSSNLIVIHEKKD